MKKLTFTIIVLCLFGACRKTESVPSEKGSLTVRVSDGGTRGLGKNGFESRIYTLTCYLFRDGVLEDTASPDINGEITFFGLNPGNYKTVMIAGDAPQAGTGITYRDFVNGKYFLYAESNGYSSGFNMFGEEDIVLGAGEAKEADVCLIHCCCKISIRDVSIFLSALLSEMGVESIDIQRFFILDAYSACHVDAEPVTAADWGSNGVESFNRWDGSEMLFSDNPARYAATCSDYSAGGEYPAFYVCPTAGSDVSVSPYLVIETLAGFEDGSSRTWYYRVCLGPDGHPVSANNEYSFSLLVTGPGADSPDKDAPGSISDGSVDEGEWQYDYF